MLNRYIRQAKTICLGRKPSRRLFLSPRLRPSPSPASHPTAMASLLGAGKPKNIKRVVEKPARPIHIYKNNQGDKSRHAHNLDEREIVERIDIGHKRWQGIIQLKVHVIGPCREKHVKVMHPAPV
jgi:hypothetical protein